MRPSEVVREGLGRPLTTCHCVSVPPGQTFAVTVDIDAVLAELHTHPLPTSAIGAQTPSAPGLYAWWAPPAVLGDLKGPINHTDAMVRLLYVGVAAKLRSRLGQNHLKRTGSSTLRRTLAGLLLDAEGFRTRWTDRVVLVDEDEARLTDWMTTNLRVTWTEYPTPRDVEPALIERLVPPLNVDHATGAARDVIKAARRRYYASAGPRPTS